jgi:hypothetical protein
LLELDAEFVGIRCQIQSKMTPNKNSILTAKIISISLDFSPRCKVTARLDVPWEGGPLETVIQQFEEASDAFGSTGGALTEEQQRDKLYDLVQTSNLMPEACQRWRMRPEVDKTWTDVCQHFQQSNP